MATEFLASSAWWLVHKGNKEDVGDVRWHVKGLQKTSSVLLLAREYNLDSRVLGVNTVLDIYT